MIKKGDTVRFHAETEDWCLDDWTMEEGDGFSELSGGSMASWPRWLRLRSGMTTKPSMSTWSSRTGSSSTRCA